MVSIGSHFCVHTHTHNLFTALLSIYTGAKTVVRAVYGNSKCFKVKVGMHQGSALSPLLFVIIMEAIPREFREHYHGSCYMLNGEMLVWLCVKVQICIWPN